MPYIFNGDEIAVSAKHYVTLRMSDLLWVSRMVQAWNIAAAYFLSCRVQSAERDSLLEFPVPSSHGSNE